MAEETINASVARRAYRRKPLGSRAALIVGFGALLVLMAIICIDSLRTLRAFETSNIQARRDFLFHDRTLEQVRAALYETGNILRDYTPTESDVRAQEMLRHEFRSIRDDTAVALKSCIDSLPAGKKDPFQHLAVVLENELDNAFLHTILPELITSSSPPVLPIVEASC